MNMIWICLTFTKVNETVKWVGCNTVPLQNETLKKQWCEVPKLEHLVYPSSSEEDYR